MPARFQSAATSLVVLLALAGCERPAPRRAPPTGGAPPAMPARGGAPAPPRPPAPAPPGEAVVVDTASAGLDPAPAGGTVGGTVGGAVARRRSCLVERVHDGDTIRCKGGGPVRLLLIDAPELSQRPFGDQSRRALARLAPVGQTVTLETDRQPRDRYGRLLAYVYGADGRMVNAEMVRAGYAVTLVYSPNGRHQAQVERAAAEAAAARRGLHATGGFSCAPREHRRKQC